jgi:asparagine synthase (glutamine-hydrolysing)
MLQALVHRGPDDEGVWSDAVHGVALGHRRLSILELSEAGHQPMISACGRYVIIFNGEVYNHQELRARLEREQRQPSRGWRGHSDTETLLQAIAMWGIVPALQAVVGMFALAVWDKEETSLVLARDRMGEKPLHYGWQGAAFLFGSELKALRAHPSFDASVDWDAAVAMLHRAYIPAPNTIYRGIQKVPPGHIVTLRQAHIASHELPQPTPYWSLTEAADRAEQEPFNGTYGEAVDALESLVMQSVRLQSFADVPVGAFLSGGIDSSTVVAMMQRMTNARVTTFSIGMPDTRFDESAHAADVARYLGTDHVEHIIQPTEALSLLARLPAIWDEPFADSSQIPTYLVSSLARQQVTVALSGDGGDELFLGYPQYATLQKVWRLRVLGYLPWEMGLRPLSHFGERWRRRVRNARAYVGGWRQADTSELNRYWMDRFRDDPAPVKHAVHWRAEAARRRWSAAQTAALADAGAYLPDCILVKVDRAAMANSLETRAPLLDHRIVEFALKLPMDFKMKDGVGKRVLRDVLYRHVPRSLVDRPKMGFSIPLGSWLRDELREWAEAMLAAVPRESQVFDVQSIKAIWSEHLAGRRDHADQLWPVLAVISWCQAHGAEV